MSKVEALCDTDREMMLEFSSLCVSRLNNYLPLKLFLSPFQHFLDANVIKEIEKDRLIIENAATHFERGRNRDDLDVNDIFEMTIKVDDEFVNKRWEEFKKLLEGSNFNLVDENEHEFELDNKKVGFASKNILIRDKIINDYSELIQYKNTNALTLKPEDFLVAYKFSIKDGYRINTREKKDKDIINMLEAYLVR